MSPDDQSQVAYLIFNLTSSGQRKSQKEIKMAESSEESSDGSNVESSEDFDGPSQSSSSEDNSTEDELETRTISRPSGSKRKKNSQPRSSVKAATKKKRTTRTKPGTSLKNDELEELTSWIFSTEQAAQVEAEIRPQVMNCPRVKAFPERERFARHVLCEAQKPNFQLLVAGFCWKFSTLVSQCSSLPDKQNRKAAFSVAWMKMLANFRLGKSSQERSIVERFLVGQQFDNEVVHAVVSLVHEMVYSCVHGRVQGRKMSNTSSDTRASKMYPESEETLYRYCGAALHRMIKLHRETLQQKKGRGKVSSERRGTMQLELDVLNETNHHSHLVFEI